MILGIWASVDMPCVVMSSIEMAPESPGREWPPPYYEASASAPHMEALGVVATIYNHLEQTLFLLILTYSKLEYDVAKSLFENITNPQRLKLLRDCSEKQIMENPTHEHVINFIECFEVVAQNRNTLMHSMIMGTGDGGILEFSKTSRAAPTVEKVLLLDVSSLHQTAFDLEDVDDYGRRIWFYYNSTASWSKKSPLSRSFLKKLALPERLLIPDTQTPKPPKPPRVSPRQRREQAMKTAK